MTADIRAVVESPIASAKDAVTDFLSQHLPTKVCSVNLFSLCISVLASVMKFRVGDILSDGMYIRTLVYTVHNNIF